MPSGRSADSARERAVTRVGEREWHEVRVGRRYNIAYANSLWTYVRLTEYTLEPARHEFRPSGLYFPR